MISVEYLMKFESILSRINIYLIRLRISKEYYLNFYRSKLHYKVRQSID